MRRITVRSANGNEMVFATNDHDGGCFERKSWEGAYRQTAGTCQTPVFKSWQQFRKYLGRLDGRVIEHTGW